MSVRACACNNHTSNRVLDRACAPHMLFESESASRFINLSLDLCEQDWLDNYYTNK